MSLSAFKSYKEANVETTDQGKLILLVYDFAIRNCKLAKEKFADGDIAARIKSIDRSQQAISELMVSLNFNKGGEIAKRLYSLYSYMNRRLNEANVKKESKHIDEVLTYLTDLREAWTVAVQKTRLERAGTRTETGAKGFATVG